MIGGDSMRIIEKGHIKRQEPKTFKCQNCSCVYEAEPGEYRLPDFAGAVQDKIEAMCDCPECGVLNYRYDVPYYN